MQGEIYATIRTRRSITHSGPATGSAINHIRHMRFWFWDSNRFTANTAKLVANFIGVGVILFLAGRTGDDEFKRAVLIHYIFHSVSRTDAASLTPIPAIDTDTKTPQTFALTLV